MKDFSKNLLADFHFRRRNELFFETTQSNVWEPGENPGRLRHCNGYKFPKPLFPLRNGKAE